MATNPLNELKRKLEDDGIPLPKRLCLAKNIIRTHHFPVAPKERVISDWLEDICKDKKLLDDEIVNVINWTKLIDEPTSILKSRLIKIFLHYIQNSFNSDKICDILSFLENPKMFSQQNIHIEDFLLITKSLLQHFCDPYKEENAIFIHTLLSHLRNFYRESKRKLEFITKLISGDNIEVIFNFLDKPHIRDGIIDVCREILFPVAKKSHYSSFLQNLSRNNNMDDLVKEKGDSMLAVEKIMNAFFTFPTGRVSKNPNFLSKFIDAFVSCYKQEHQIVFTFYVIAMTSMNMQQNYVDMSILRMEGNTEKFNRSLFSNMIEFLIRNEIEININLTDAFSEKTSKVTVKKNFMTFLQAVMMNQLKLEGKPDKITMQIVKLALKLDPMLIEQKMDEIIPPIMAAKKTNALKSYTEMLEYLIEVLFKLSRGMSFLNRMLPHVKTALEAGDTEIIESKIINGGDVFPAKCVEKFGQLSSESLLFRQIGEFFLLLQSDFEEHCISMLQEGNASRSVTIIAEVMSSVLSSVLDHNKMADHTVPLPIAEDFWKTFDTFENKFLRNYGECILNLEEAKENSQLTLSFLKLCASTAQLKLLSRKYANVKTTFFPTGHTDEVLDLSSVLPCLDGAQWISLSKRIQDSESLVILNNLLLLKMMVLQLSNESIENEDDSVKSIRTHLIKEVLSNNHLLEDNSYFSKTLLRNLDNKQVKLASKGLSKMLLGNPESPILKNEAVLSYKPLLTALVMEVLKAVIQILESSVSENATLLSKVVTKPEFLIATFVKNLHFDNYFEQLTMKRDFLMTDLTILANSMEVLMQLRICDLNENCQLTAIFVLLALKRACSSKKLKKNVDSILQVIFELSPKYPNLYKIFPIDFMFNFQDETFLRLATLATKSDNLLLIKCLLESTVKQVKTESDIVRKVVKILLTNQKSSDKSNINCFGNRVFQISCIILPIIAKDKKAITTSAYRSVLAELQEKLHKSLLKTFKSVDFKDNSGEAGDTVSDTVMATLNAMEAYSLTLSKYCESTDIDAIKDLDCLWSGLEHFVQNAINSIQNADAKQNHVNASIHLLNNVLRNIRKLQSHEIFQNKDEIFVKIWQCLKSRLFIVFSKDNSVNAIHLDDISVTMKFVCEFSGVECFQTNFIGDLLAMVDFKKQTSIVTKDTLVTHKVVRKLWNFCMKSNIVGAKCTALSKCMYEFCKELTTWIRRNYDIAETLDVTNNVIDEDSYEKRRDLVEIDDAVCELIKIDVDCVTEVIFAAKKISLNYKFMDAIFELQHMLHFILGLNPCRIVWQTSYKSFFNIFEGSVMLLNALLLAREELLEDRWPCYIQCYRALICCICEKSSSSLDLERNVEEKMAELAHSIEKLTQAMCKRKNQVSRLATYLVADISSSIERNSPSRLVRQHLENAAVSLIQISDSSYAMSFLRRSLAGSPGQITMTNLYTMYKRYHKYVGNA